MSKAKWCVRCGEERRDVAATEEVEGDPLCGMHARIAYALEAGCAVKVEEQVETVSEAPQLCSRGCGKPMHRGRCGGLSPTVVKLLESKATVAACAEKRNEGEGMDVLVCEEIPVAQVPSGRTRNIGRLGMLWARLMATPLDVALKVKCRDSKHANSTARHMTLKARKAGVAIVSRRVGDNYFCHRVSAEVER